MPVGIVVEKEVELTSAKAILHESSHAIPRDERF